MQTRTKTRQISGKKQRSEAVKKSDENSKPAGLTIRGRLLPWQLESACYDFMELRDIAAVYLVSRGMKSAAVHHLKERRGLLHCQLMLLSRSKNSVDELVCLGLDLAARFCESLRQVVSAHGWFDPRSLAELGSEHSGAQSRVAALGRFPWLLLEHSVTRRAVWLFATGVLAHPFRRQHSNQESRH